MNASRDIYAGVRVGTVIGSATLLYVKGGYTNARSTADYRDGGSGATDADTSGTSDGYRVGAGVERRLGQKLLAKVEYRFSDYGDGISRHQVAMGVGVRFPDPDAVRAGSRRAHV